MISIPAEIEALHIANILGFHDLAEQEAAPLTPLQRATYEARVYGVELARRMFRLLCALQDDE